MNEYPLSYFSSLKLMVFILSTFTFASYLFSKNTGGFIKKNPTRCNSVSEFIIPYLYEAQHVSGDTPPSIRSLKLHWQPLVFRTWKVVGRVVGGRCQAHTVPRPPTTRPTTFQVWKTTGCQCSFRLLMMGGLSPETCWASYKYGIINSDTLLHLVRFFFMNYTMMHGSTNIKYQWMLIALLIKHASSSTLTVTLPKMRFPHRNFIGNIF